MSGTSASSPSIGGVGLPAPVVRVGEFNTAATAYVVPDGGPRGAGATVAATITSQVSVSAHGLPQMVMDDLATFQPRLELVRYVRKRSSSDAFSRNFRNAGYVHPSSVATGTPSGSHTHGGAHSFVTPTVTALRQTEWDVLNFGQVFDVTQSMLGFMQLTPVRWRDSAGNVNFEKLVIPSGSSCNGGLGKRYPYSGRYFPGYFKFRWSVIDASDSRGQRISGPTSDTVSVTHEVFPFLPAAPDPVGRAAATLNPGFDVERLRVWIGAVSRLPR